MESVRSSRAWVRVCAATFMGAGLFLLLFGGLFAPYGVGEKARAAEGAILFTRVDDSITPVIASHLSDGVDRAESGDYEAYLVELDTPGGHIEAMRDIVETFLLADVPVVVYVTPAGSRAASAGALITFSAHIAAMAPGTTIGAATPVDAEGNPGSDKVINAFAAYAEGVAAERGRNVEFAAETVRDGRAVTAEEALELDAIDLVSPDLQALLQEIDGRTVSLDGREVTLDTANAALDEQNLGLFRSILQILADPNVAFLLVSLGTLAIIYEFANPGVGLAGIFGFIFLIIGFFALSVLPVNVAGVALLVLAAALFIAEIFAPGIGVFAAGGTIALLLGGLFLFEGSSTVRVAPAVLLPTVLVIGGAVVLAGRLAWRARRAKPSSGDDLLVGATTVVRSIDSGGVTGKAIVEGALWTLRLSATQRQAGRNLVKGEGVTVLARENLDLIVEPIEETPPAPSP